MHCPRPRIGVLIVHGMGSQPAGYSRGMQAVLCGALGRAASRFVFEEVLWSKVLWQVEDELLARMREARDPSGAVLPLGWNRLREFIVHGFADALAYHRGMQSTSLYGEVHDAVSTSVRALRLALDDPEAPVVVLAHSLGAHVVSNYVWDTEVAPAHLPDCDGSDRADGAEPHRPPASPPPWEPIPTLTAMITFGSNIPLFGLAVDLAEPIVLPAAGVADVRLRELSRWLNFYDPADVLGWPLRSLYTPDLGRMHCARRQTVARIEDREIDAGWFPANLTPLSHSLYWTEAQLIQPVAAYLRILAEVVSSR